MRQFLLAVIWLFLISDKLHCSETLELAVEDAAGPWSEKDGSGYANEVVVAAYKAKGIDVKLHVMPYSRCKHLAVEGDMAGCFSMSKAPELDGVIELAERPLFVCYSDYFQNKNKPINAKSEAEIPKGTIVGIVEGYEYPPSFHKLRKEGTIVIEEASTEELNLKKLANGRIDLALINYNEIKPVDNLASKAGCLGKIECAFRSGTLESFIGFSKKHPKGSFARDDFNEGFKIIAKDGTLQEIQSRWIKKAKEAIEKLASESTKESAAKGK